MFIPGVLQRTCTIKAPAASALIFDLPPLVGLTALARVASGYLSSLILIFIVASFFFWVGGITTNAVNELSRAYTSGRFWAS